jgi:hypothetical protein
MNIVLQTRDAFVAHILATAPDSSFRIWLLAQLAEIEENTEPCVAAGVFDAAVDGSTEWTDNSSYTDPVLEELFDTFLNDDLFSN